MEILIGLAIVIGIVAYWFYQSGKRTGSRKGYNAGLHRRRRRRRR